MSQIQLNFLPPEYWQDFQKIVLADAKGEWPDAVCEIFGRDGQRQDGIDVLVTSDSRGVVGIQAKKRRLNDADGAWRLDGGLKKSDIDKMVTEAEKYKPPLNEFVIVTTALPDAELQKHVSQLNVTRAKQGQFKVRIQFWDHYQSVLNWNSDLQAVYYGDVVARTEDYQPTRHYLMLVRTAFNRAAFTTRLELEDSGGDMVQALEDTRGAIVLGILKDRGGRRIGRSPIGLVGFTDSTAENLEEAVRLLDEARQHYRRATEQGDLSFSSERVCPQGERGRSAARKIDSLRARALDEVNVVLAATDLKPLANYLHPHPHIG